MTRYYLDFEKPIQDLELKIEELRSVSNGSDVNIDSELKKLEEKAEKLRQDIFSKLTPWQKTQIARHPDRPYTLDYISMITEDFIELHGDRRFGDDPAVVGGPGSIEGKNFMIIGHQKGRGTKERITRNFGQPHPEGYRKAKRLMEMAERFNMPVLTFVDTPGAFPGIGAEERGQAEAIATNLMVMSQLRVPIISVVIGEGGSGGALALSVADRLLMLEHAVYSVISPEGCAAILWKKDGDIGTADYERAAEALKLTAQDLLKLKIIDGIIPEPSGGAHRDPARAARNIKETVLESLEELQQYEPEKLIEKRYRKLRKIGQFSRSKE
ncbi:MAG TPA: acetyl-CoA carboxylase carboxyltransferase subunit alpha [Nitrospirae bacterium]|nr:acetyl-CoA carboxylase carboxyltransferase subunit alpha [Nitrospirota bacterium]